MNVYAGLYATSKRYVDVVKTLGTKYYGMTRRELANLRDLSKTHEERSNLRIHKQMKRIWENGIRNFGTPFVQLSKLQGCDSRLCSI